MASAAGGTSQRLNSGPAIILSRLKIPARRVPARETAASAMIPSPEAYITNSCAELGQSARKDGNVCGGHGWKRHPSVRAAGLAPVRMIAAPRAADKTEPINTPI